MGVGTEIKCPFNSVECHHNNDKEVPEAVSEKCEKNTSPSKTTSLIFRKQTINARLKLSACNVIYFFIRHCVCFGFSVFLS